MVDIRGSRRLVRDSVRRMLAVKLDDLNLIPTIYKVDGENPSDVCIYTMTCTHLPNTPIQTTTFFPPKEWSRMCDSFCLFCFVVRNRVSLLCGALSVLEFAL